MLSIANFRYRPAGRDLSDAGRSTASTGRSSTALVGDGSFFLAPTVLKGRTALRVSITNFRTREEDLLALLDEAARIGRELVGPARRRYGAFAAFHASRLRSIWRECFSRCSA